MKHIRTSKLSKVIACYLALQIVLTTIQPMQLFALTGGPSQPEFNSFTPIGTSDMVNLSSGDFNYNIPIMDVGGYPLNLAYDSGITMDQEASWVGLGWNLNIGQINRQLRGLPDDFNGDEITYENNLRTNFTAGINTGLKFPVFGNDFFNLGLGLGMKYNNYDGISFNSNYGASFNITEQVSVGLNISNTNGEGVNVEPTVGINAKRKKKNGLINEAFSASVGVPFNSRQGIMGLNLSASRNSLYKESTKNKGYYNKIYGKGTGASLSFNDNLSFTPTNQLSFINANLTLNFGLDAEIWGLEMPHVDITGFGSIQILRGDDKIKKIKGYGYANTENASTLNAVLDFNRENDRTITKNSTMLPIVNQTYDLYAIKGQGVGGMFRPHRSQVGHVFDQTVTYFGVGGSAGFEIGPGVGVHFGGNVKVNPSFTRSGRWQDGTNPELGKFTLNNNQPGQKIDYEPVYYKTMGELTADVDTEYSSSIINEPNPIKMGIGGGEYNRRTTGFYKVKKYGNNLAVSYDTKSSNKIKRKKRQTRSQSVQMIKYGDIKNGNVDGQIRLNTLPNILNDGTSNRVPDDHHVGIKVLKPDGNTYVFGETAYNKKKVEATFAVNSTGNCLTGLVSYTNTEDSRSNSSGRDHFFNKTHTPGYAHSYLLSSVLSSDYEDLTNDGPTDDDLGAYTKFTYFPPINYNWRVPFERNKATFSEGLKADTRDNKGNYVYGEKELKYVRKIETKTHIAVFKLTPRRDGYGVSGEDGGIGLRTYSRKIENIKLYSKPEYKADPINATPIKTAHFEYNYELCNNLPNNRDYNTSTKTGPGKLTLQKVYFTYRNSNMGQYTPYQFVYDGNNPDYHLKGYDVWGNYKAITGGCGVNDNVTTPEFPFVQQDNRELQNQNAAAWTMTSINLPSGGKLALEYETDDYGSVQNKDTMQMFKVVGAGDSTTSIQGTSLYNGGDDFDYLYVPLADGTSLSEFRYKYLRDIGTSDANPMYFKFLLNMTSGTYDNVSGYALINKEESQVFTEGGVTYGAIKLRRVKKEGGIINSNQMVNPIAKAGWYFGRTHLNRQVYGLPAPEIDGPGDLVALGQAFVSAIADVSEIFIGPNQKLRDKNCAKYFKPKKSWVRLYHPDKTKLGGGIRVKKLMLHDNWDVMTSNSGNQLYSNSYGQEYTYTDEEGNTSGVASFEPNGSKENPLIQPFYDNPKKLQAPKEYNYVEKPIGQSLYPSPKVTYGRVVVENLKRQKQDGTDTNNDPVITTLKKHATGRVINEFYTTKDFPTIADFTNITPKVDITGILGSVLKVRTNKNLTYSQGFVVRTNDMDGKQKSQKVQTEGQSGNEFISKVDYKYSIDSNGNLDNNLDVIGTDGKVSKALLGVTHDMVHDFRSYENSSIVAGVDGNLAALFVFFGIALVPTILPVVQFHKQELKTVTTTKVIHSMGILKEKIAYDLGSRVSTKNMVWDGQTGDVLLTKTINEYDENYFNFTYPANWNYKNMGAASNNLNVQGFLTKNTVDYTITNPVGNINIDAKSILVLGDELLINRMIDDGSNNRTNTRVWVAGFNGTKAYLIDKDGAQFELEDAIIGQAGFKVYRSGYRNLQTASMASVMTQKNPIVGIGLNRRLTTQVDWGNLNVINSSAIEYSDAWDSQCEFRLPNPDGVLIDQSGDVINTSSLGFNPYLYNVKGDWRAIKSYAYLTARNNGSVGYNPRKEGFFNTFRPFYKYASNSWSINNSYVGSKWTFTSEVTQYSPYGAELENRDALNRHSSVQYGYRYTLPTAVGSNAKYQELAFDGFEDYAFTPLNTDNSTAINPHFGFQDEVLANANASVSDQESHSGRKSIKINAGSNAKITHRLVSCDTDDSTPNGLPNAVNNRITNNCQSIRKSITFDVLNNDSYGTDGPSTTDSVLSIIVQPTNGIVQINLNNTITYTKLVANANDNFTYQICDANGDCDTAIVTLSCSIIQIERSN